MSAAIFFGGAAMIAISVVLGRKFVVVIRERRFLQLAGRDPAAPVPVASYAEIDAAIERSKCACKGPMIKIGEGPAAMVTTGLGVQTPPMVVRTLTECRYCGRRAPLYFDTSGIPQ